MASDIELVQIVDAAVAEAVRRAGTAMVCRKGCTHCCIGPFAVTERDLERLRVGFGLLDERLKERMALRFAEARETMREEFPGNWVSGRLTSQEAADLFDLRHPWLPCPVLDLETGACSLHAWRPVACRLHGPALRVNGVDLRHCRLNYTGVGVEELRVAVELPEEEESPLTYIAWAVRP
ncbi:MAG: YkgJ family cysteine cluster protein [Acidobacteria bacterium]|nr:YkgJ family cysteine cluster protein [Acidobacteriota bacterium]